MCTCICYARVLVKTYIHMPAYTHTIHAVVHYYIKRLDKMNSLFIIVQGLYTKEYIIWEIDEQTSSGVIVYIKSSILRANWKSLSNCWKFQAKWFIPQNNLISSQRKESHWSLIRYKYDYFFVCVWVGWGDTYIIYDYIDIACTCLFVRFACLVIELCKCWHNIGQVI